MQALKSFVVDICSSSCGDSILGKNICKKGLGTNLIGVKMWFLILFWSELLPSPTSFCIDIMSLMVIT